MSFAALPHELQLRILLHALQPPHGHANQAPTLALVSRQCHAIVRKLLWAHIRIVKPSQLRLIHAALRANPALGDLVRSLHLGPQEELRAQGWPLVMEDEGDGVSLHLVATSPEALLPRWVGPESTFNIEHEEDSSCKHVAVHYAIEEAFEQIDVNPRRSGWSSWRGSQSRIGMRAWSSRLWQVQAALDLYLAEMRRWEDAGNYLIKPWSPRDYPHWRMIDENCRFGRCGHYPALELQRDKQKHAKASCHSHRSEADKAGLQRFHVTREQLWSHICKYSDHFDHLLLFLRSGGHDLQLDKDGWELLKRDIGGPHWDLFTGDQTDEEAADELSISSDEEEQDNDMAASCSSFKMYTAEDVLVSAREVLGLTGQLRSLSLTGFLFRALDGLQTASSLARLSIGPFARWWEHVLSTTDQNSTSSVKEEGEGGEERMTRLARLRICGMLSDLDALKIATQMPSLESVTWEVTDRGYVDAIVQAVQCLQGQLSQPVVPSKRQRTKRYTEVRLRRSNVKKVLAAAPSTEVSDAWRYGWPVQGAPHTVKVMASSNVRKEEFDDEVDKTTAAQYEEAKRWWEAGRVGLRMHSAAGEGG